MARMTDVTRILGQIEQGDPHAADQLLPLVYDELRKLAVQRLALEKIRTLLGKMGTLLANPFREGICV